MAGHWSRGVRLPFIEKPFRLARLAPALRELLDRSQAGPPGTIEPR